MDIREFAWRAAKDIVKEPAKEYICGPCEVPIFLSDADLLPALNTWFIAEKIGDQIKIIDFAKSEEEARIACRPSS